MWSELAELALERGTDSIEDGRGLKRVVAVETVDAMTTVASIALR